MDVSAQWPQDIGVVKPMNDHHQEMVVNSNMNTCSSRPTPPSTSTMLERKAISRPQKEQVINCPRCNSTNTKFCYYNNYSLTQPRYFCKTCRRYWTEGGSLRNVPVGGGSRKNKRSSSSTSSSPSSTNTTTSSSKRLASSTDQNPKIIEAQDLNLAYPIRHEYLDHHQFVVHENNNNNDPSPSSTTTTSSLSALELLRTGMSTNNSSRGLINSFMPMPSTQQPHDTNTTVYSSSGFGLQDFKPTLNFGLDGLGSGGYGSSSTTTLQEVHDHNVNGRPISFPFEDLKQVSSTSHDDHHQFEQNRSGLVLQGSTGTGTTTTTHDTNGYWNGMLSGGSW